MTRKNWDNLARKQFEEMPAEFQDDWKELRQIVYKSKQSFVCTSKHLTKL